jgi:hypothetical protein
VNAAEHDEFVMGAFGGDLGELERIALDVRVADDFIALVIVAKHNDAVAQLALGRLGALCQFNQRQVAVVLEVQRLGDEATRSFHCLSFSRKRPRNLVKFHSMVWLSLLSTSPKDLQYSPLERPTSRNAAYLELTAGKPSV